MFKMKRRSALLIQASVLAGAVDNDRIHRHRLTLILHETETWGC